MQMMRPGAVAGPNFGTQTPVHHEHQLLLVLRWDPNPGAS